MLTIQVDTITSKILEILPREIFTALDAELSYEVEGHFFSVQYQQGYWDGRKKLMTKQKFPTGLLPHVRKVFQELNVPYQIIDKRSSPPIGTPIPLHNVELYDYQEDAVQKAIERERGLIQIATGGGKTNVAAGIIARLGLPTIFYTHRETIAIQTRERLQNLLQQPIGLIGSGKSEVEKITVAMIQSLGKEKYNSLVKDTPVMIIDESHHTACDTIWDLHKKSDAYYRYGLSATPWREDGADLLIEAATANPIVKISASDLIRKGRLSKPYIYFVRIPRLSKVSSGSLSYPAIYTQGVVDNDERNFMIAHLCNYLATLDKKILVAVSRIAHGRLLLSILQSRYPKVKSVFIQGEDGGDIKFQTLKYLNDGHVSVVVATPIYGEGIDIPQLDVLINAKAQKSTVDAFQLVGRALRISATKKKALIIDFYDCSKYLLAHAKSRIDILKTEPEYVIKIVDSIDEIEIPS